MTKNCVDCFKEFSARGYLCPTCFQKKKARVFRRLARRFLFLLVILVYLFLAREDIKIFSHKVKGETQELLQNQREAWQELETLYPYAQEGLKQGDHFLDDPAYLNDIEEINAEEREKSSLPEILRKE